MNFLAKVKIELNSKAPKAEKTLMTIRFEKKTYFTATTGMSWIEMAIKSKKLTSPVGKFDPKDLNINIKNFNMKANKLTPYAHYQNTEE